MEKNKVEKVDIDDISRICEISKSSLKKLKLEIEKKYKKTIINYENFQKLMLNDDINEENIKILFNILDLNSNNIIGI